MMADAALPYATRASSLKLADILIQTSHIHGAAESGKCAHAVKRKVEGGFSREWSEESNEGQSLPEQTGFLYYERIL
jgi:hypothetical protein